MECSLYYSQGVFSTRKNENYNCTFHYAQEWYRVEVISFVAKAKCNMVHDDTLILIEKRINVRKNKEKLTI